MKTTDKVNYSETKVCQEIQRRNGKESLRIGIREFKGKKYIEQRIWFQGKSGTFLPSRKGVIFTLGELPAVVSGLCSIAENEGLTVATPI